MPLRAAVLTVSDLGARGERVDTAGPAVAELLRGAGFEVSDTTIVPDEPDQISGRLVTWCDEGIDLIATTGGTGLSRRDRTPEATLRVVEYRVPGMEEGMRAAGRASTPLSMLTRAVVGVRGQTLVINLPGSERGARENLEALLPVLQHACESLRGDADEVAGTHDEMQR
ncbi:MAG: molybdenum cofactor biosynthesis protein [Dehalococcoidia bacterium]|nr:molybdenum cofactor biosynthesis protein [Dehalococcoidia bacterium]